MGDWRLVVHGGAGVIERGQMDPRKEAEVRASLDRALELGGAILAQDGSSLDAVEAAVRHLEDDPHFNAGRGSAFTFEGRCELDAAIMEGRELRAGACAGVTTTRNPVLLARAVMERTPHVLLAGPGADIFSVEMGLDQAGQDWFGTEERRKQLEAVKERGADWFDVEMKYGTVGAVALDRHGTVAAATSTGGITGKRWGRVGDSPLIGSGTYADNRAGAVSATGTGESFIRLCAAYEILARLRRGGGSAAEAAGAVLAEVEALGGTGGVIFVTPGGEAGWSLVSPGMYRGRASPDGRETHIYDEA